LLTCTVRQPKIHTP